MCHLGTCEQDAEFWLCLSCESQGLLKPDDPAAVEALFAAFPVQPLPVQPNGIGRRRKRPPRRAPKPAAKNPFSCDDPTAE